MKPLILVAVYLLAVVTANPFISEKNEETSNQLFSNDPAFKSDEKYLQNVNTIIKNEETLEASLTQSQPIQSRSLGSTSQSEARKKSKIKKIKKGLKKAFVPILIFILVKAMILIPLALAVLAFKTWNALQLSFVSFVTGLALALWKFCSNLNKDEHLPVVHGGWDLDRSGSGQLLAYSGYVPQ